MFTSTIQERGSVPFAAFNGDRIYMRKFTKKAGLPSDIKHWQPTVDAMLDGIDADDDIFLMVDQGFVEAGKTHRRSGLHIDGYWIEGLQAHGDKGRGWKIKDFSEKEGIILASNLSAARGFCGDWIGEIGDGGDCSGIDVSRLSEIIMQAGKVYAGNVTSLHESLPVAADCYRTLVRLNVKGWHPAA